ncbi:hypothetical protein XENTR_v10023211 [Xenopus tropicalis]|nr:hypothetical protein XENTR_v10023211 [Xenopus tropicalis]
MTEEPNETVCWFKNKEQRKERILNLTLEIIYLLTGEGYVIPKKKSPTVGLGALHAPGSVIQKENDKKILELISNIIQLLTGEVAIRCEDVSIYFSLEEWEYIKENKALYREGIKEEEEPQQLRPLDCVSEDIHNIEGNLVTLYCDNDPNKIVSAETDSCLDDHFPKTEISPVEQPPPTNGIKEEAASCEGGNQSDCSINPLTEQIQGTDTPTPIMGCSLNNHTAEDYTSNGIKETASCKGGHHSDVSSSFVVEQIQEADRLTPVTGYSLNNNPTSNYIPDAAMEESVSYEEKNISDCSINPLTEQIQGMDTPTSIMGCSLNNSISANDIIIATIKQEAISWERGHSSYCSINPLTEQIQGTDAPSPIMGCSLNSKFADNFISDDIKKEAASWEGGNQSDCTINPLTEQIQGMDTPIMGFSRNNSSEDNYISYNMKEEPVSWKGENHSSYGTNPLAEQTHETETVMGNILNNSLTMKCSDYGRNLSNKLLLKPPFRSRSLPGMHSCTVCHRIFHSESTLGRHQRKIHKIDKPFGCSECGKRFKLCSKLATHQRYHTGEKPFSCSDCGKCFTHRSDLNRHRKTHNGDKPFPCPDCGKRFAQRSDLKRHYRTHNGEKPFSCPECGKCFSQRSLLNKHLTTHGEDAFPLEFGKCFNHLSDFGQQKTDAAEKQFSCSECDKCFKHYSDLKKHQRVHTGEKPFSCAECGRSFTQRANLNKHNRIHTGEKPFSCSECGKSFIQRAQLIQHQRSHNGARPFSCSDCRRSFKYYADLKKHQRIHTVDMPFSCAECGKGFSLSTQLYRHQLNHSQPKPQLSIQLPSHATGDPFSSTA